MIYIEDELEDELGELEELGFRLHLPHIKLKIGKKLRRILPYAIPGYAAIKLGKKAVRYYRRHNPHIRLGWPSLKIGKFKFKLKPKHLITGALIGAGAATGILPATLPLLTHIGAKILPSALKAGSKVLSYIPTEKLKDLLKSKGGQMLFKKILGKGQEQNILLSPSPKGPPQPVRPSLIQSQQTQQTNYLPILALLGLGLLMMRSKK